MLDYLKHRYRHLRLLWRLVRDELQSHTPVPIRHRIALYRRGCLSRSYALYDLARYPIEAYISDWEKACMSLFYQSRNPRAGYEYGVNNKLFSTALLGQYVRVPQIYACIEHGQVLPLASNDKFQRPWSEICQSLGGVLVFKPTAGGQGKGVFMLSCEGGDLLINGEHYKESDVDGCIKNLDEYLVVEFIRQGACAMRLFPESTNTLRVITIIDPSDGRPYMPIAMHRIGRMASRPVDNSHRGGVSAEVDCDTGILQRVAARDRKGRLSWHEVHPETGAPISGVQIPNWGGIKQKILDTASRLAFYKFMSWDIIVTDDGFAVIEADVVSGLRSLQQHRPLLLDDRLRRFMEYHGLIKRRDPAQLQQTNASAGSPGEAPA